MFILVTLYLSAHGFTPSSTILDHYFCEMYEIKPPFYAKGPDEIATSDVWRIKKKYGGFQPWGYPTMDGS